jgi:hypothetical protein
LAWFDCRCEDDEHIVVIRTYRHLKCVIAMVVGARCSDGDDIAIASRILAAECAFVGYVVVK